MAIRCKKCAVGLLGACSLDYCQTEREMLIQQAQQAAEQRGHVLGEFAKVEQVPIWQARCSQCGKPAAINLDPATGEPDVYGEAVADVCPEADASQINVSPEKDSEEAWYKDLGPSE